MVSDRLIQRELRGRQRGGYRIDTGRVRDAQQICIPHRQDNQVAGIRSRQLRAGKVVFRGNVVLQGRDVHQILCKGRAEVHHLKGSDDRIQSWKLQAKGRKVYLLHLDVGRTGNGREQRLQLLETLAVRILQRGLRQNLGIILQSSAKSALNRVVQRQVNHRAGRLALHDTAAEGILRGLSPILPRRS